MVVHPFSFPLQGIFQTKKKYFSLSLLNVILFTNYRIKKSLYLFAFHSAVRISIKILPGTFKSVPSSAFDSVTRIGIWCGLRYPKVFLG